MSESEAISMLLQGHNAFMDVMARRHRNIRVLRSEWLSRGHKVIIMYCSLLAKSILVCFIEV